MPDTSSCLFCRIARGEIPSHRVHESEHAIAFLDIRPIRKGHVLVVPREHFPYYDDLRAEVAKTVGAAQADRLAAAVMDDYRAAGLPPADVAMLDFAVKLTRTPGDSVEDDLTQLRDVGFTDEDILHIVEVTAIFNYNVRLATATGLFPNAEYHALGRTTAT